MIDTLIDMIAEPLITGLIVASPIILNAIDNKFKKDKKEQRKIERLSNEARMHVEAYKTKKMIDYYSTVNQGVVSLPAFIEAKKAMENRRYELY